MDRVSKAKDAKELAIELLVRDGFFQDRARGERRPVSQPLARAEKLVPGNPVHDAQFLVFDGELPHALVFRWKGLAVRDQIGAGIGQHGTQSEQVIKDIWISLLVFPAVPPPANMQVQYFVDSSRVVHRRHAHKAVTQTADSPIDEFEFRREWTIHSEIGGKMIVRHGDGIGVVAQSVVTILVGSGGNPIPGASFAVVIVVLVSRPRASKRVQRRQRLETVMQY